MAQNEEFKLIITGDASGAEKAVATLTKAVNSLDSTLSSSFDGSSFRHIADGARLAGREIQKSREKFLETNRAIAESRNITVGLRGAFNGLSNGLSGIGGQVAIIGSQIAAAFSLQSVIKASDDFTNLSSKLKLVTESSEEYNKAQAEVFRIAQSGKAPLTDVGTLYARLAPVFKTLGRSQSDTVKVTEALTLALKVNGATSAEAGSAITQFSQAMASGTFAGEEFNSVNEAAPNLIRAIAEQLGVTVAELKKMKEDGKLTSEVIAGAVIPTLETFRAQSEAMGNTVGGAITRLANAFTKLVGEGAGGKMQLLVDAIEFINRNLDTALLIGAGVAFVALGSSIVLVSKPLVSLGIEIAKAIKDAGGLAAVVRTLGGGFAASSATAIAFAPLVVGVGNAAYQAAKYWELYAENRELANQRDKDIKGLEATVASLEAFKNASKFTTEEFLNASDLRQNALKRELESAREYYRTLAQLEARKGNTKGEEAAITQAAALTRRLTDIKIAEDNRYNVSQKANLEKALVAAKANYAEIQKAIQEGNSTILQSDAERAKKQVEVNQQAAQAVLEAWKSTIVQIDDANKKAAEAADKATSIRQETQDKLKSIANQGLTDEEKVQVAQTDAIEAYSAARTLALQAEVAKGQKNVELFDQLSRKADEAFKKASGLAEQAGDTDIIERSGEQRAQLEDSRAEAALKSKKDLEEQAAAQLKTLDELEARILKVKQEQAAIDLQVTTDTAIAAIEDIEARLKKLAEGVTVPVKVEGGPGSATAPEIQANAKGGYIRGPGTGTSDSILSWLSNTEYVIKAASVKKFGVGFFDALNSGRLPAFASGGLVGNIDSPSINPPRQQQNVSATFNIGSLGSFPATVSKAVAQELDKVLSMEALRRGRR